MNHIERAHQQHRLTEAAAREVCERQCAGGSPDEITAAWRAYRLAVSGARAQFELDMTAPSVSVA